MDKPRRRAFEILCQINIDGKYSNLALKSEIEDFNDKDRSFITALVYGTLDKQINLDYIIAKFAKGRIQSKIANILRLGTYQILYMDKIPDSAAVNTCVELAADIGKGALKGYINGVLRNISRNKENIDYPADKVQYLSKKYSYPECFVSEMIKTRGFEATEKFCAYEPKHRTSIRIDNNQKPQIPFEQGIYFDNFIYLSEKLPDTKYSVQSESSYACVLAVSPQNGESILDCCAAPGGKTVAMAQLMQHGKIVALDKHKHRVELIEKNVKRCNQEKIVEAKQADMLEENELGTFDKVLVDAPCSGLGVIGGKPEIKNNITKQKLKDIENTQRVILQNASKHVKKGGRLIYSTCTVRNEENINIVKEFLENNKNFELEDMSGLFGEKFEKGRDLSKGYLQLYPEIDKVDGFFISRMKRI